MDDKKKHLLWGALASMVLLFILGAWLRSGKTNAAGAGKPTNDKGAEYAMTKVTLMQPRVEEVEVGTEWYDPNTEMRYLHIWGHPMVPNVKWQMRYNYNDRTIKYMGPINSPQKRFVDWEIPNITSIEYRVDPNQPVKRCKFRFQFSPPRS